MPKECDHDFPIHDGRCVGCGNGMEGDALRADQFAKLETFRLWVIEVATTAQFEKKAQLVRTLVRIIERARAAGPPRPTKRDPSGGAKGGSPP